MDVPRITDPRQLRALAHPLRLRLLGLLRLDGPSTATRLAERVGESSGSASYHLRQLAQHGFIEEDPDRGVGRERWWRTASGGHAVWAEDFPDAPELSVYLNEIVNSHAAFTAGWLADQENWDREWVEAADFSDFLINVPAARLRELTAEMYTLIERYRDRPPEPGNEQVHVIIHAFPRRPES